MDQIKELATFVTSAINDHRIGTTHISLYMALFHFYNLNEFRNPVNITRSAVMRVAKISGLATYHKCMKDLSEAGYIEYVPSFNPSVSSTVLIKSLL